MPKMVLNNILGLAPGPTTRTNLKLGEAYHIASSFAVDPISLPGVIKPGRTFSTDLDGNNNISAVIKRGVGFYDTASKFFLTEHGTKTHAASATDGTLDDAGSFGNFPITTTATGSHGAHTTFVNEDITVYPVGSTNYIFVSYNDNTDGDVARYTTDGATKVYDFMSNTASGGAALGKFPHILLTPENGFMYMTDGPSIHKFDGATGANGTFTGTVIDLPRGWIIRDYIDYGSFCWLFAIQDFSNGVSGLSSPRKAAVFLWNYINKRSNEFTGFAKDGPFYFPDVADIGPIFSHDGIPHVFVLTPHNTTQIRRFSGSEFATVWEEPGNLIPYKGGISKFYGHIMWQPKTANLGVYTFGRTSRDFPEVFNHIGTTAGTSGGLLTIGANGNYWIAYDTELKLFQGLYQNPQFITLVAEFPKLSMVKSMTVFYRSFSSVDNSELNLSFYKDFKSSPISGTYKLTHPLDGARGYKYIKLGGKNFQNINTLRMLFNYSMSGSATESFEIYRIEVEYEPMGKIK